MALRVVLALFRMAAVGVSERSLMARPPAVRIGSANEQPWDKVSEPPRVRTTSLTENRPGDCVTSWNGDGRGDGAPRIQSYHWSKSLVERANMSVGGTMKWAAAALIATVSMPANAADLLPPSPPSYLSPPAPPFRPPLQRATPASMVMALPARTHCRRFWGDRLPSPLIRAA
jgi:hypothetical protein